MIRVSTYPFRNSHNTFRTAVDTNDRDPAQARARSDSQLLAGSELQSHSWSDTSCSLQFSNGRSLVIHVADHQVDWGVSDGLPKTRPGQTSSWGPVSLSLAGRREPFEFDPNSLLSELHGSTFRELYYLADLGWLALYTQRNEPLSFYPLRREDSGQDMLYTAWLG